MHHSLSGSKILVTGGTGSFGQAAASHFLKQGVEEIRIFSRDEKKQDDMRKFFSDTRLKFYLGDVRDINSISDASCGIDYVFAAAALKQVPSCEFYPMQAVLTNIHGIENTLQASINNRVKSVVVLSTDKAVYPVNAMGMTKALMEKVSIAKSRLDNASQTNIAVTRYGNVMASRGSVIPLFINQIKTGRPLTVTDPGMTRFMMLLEEAVDLVLYAFSKSTTGDIFIQKSPSATIGQIARVLLDIFNASNPIEIIGIRHGEKEHEMLMSSAERKRSLEYDNFYCIKPDDRDLNYDQYFDKGDVNRQREYLDYTSDNSYQLSDNELKDMLCGLSIVQSNLYA